MHFRRARAGRREIGCTSEPQNGLPSAQGVPRVARLMALALRFEGLVRDGQVSDYAALARLGHVSRTRLAQIMNLALLVNAASSHMWAEPARGCCLTYSIPLWA